MLPSIHLKQDKEGDHNAPRHLAEVVRGNCRSPASMWVMSAGIVGEIEALHLSIFSVRPCDVANSLTRLIWSLQSEMFVKSVRMSSACEKAPR